jgi:hypothetical protein
MSDAHCRPTDARIRWSTPSRLLHTHTSDACSRGGGQSGSQSDDCLPPAASPEAPALPAEWMAEDDRRRVATMAAGRARLATARNRSRR